MGFTKVSAKVTSFEVAVHEGFYWGMSKVLIGDMSQSGGIGHYILETRNEPSEIDYN